MCDGSDFGNGPPWRIKQTLEKLVFQVKTSSPRIFRQLQGNIS